jgi:UDP-N-acetylmuramate dehydrogenase
VFHHLEALDLETNEIIILDTEQFQFGYRESVFKHELKGKTIILSVTFLLTRNPKINTQYGAINDILKERNITNPTPKDVSNAVIYIRQSKLPDPAVTGNAGSFFKNPEVPISHYQTLLSQYPTIPSYPTREGFCKIPAGWLIEQAGWKGHNRITHGVHPKQALVLVNYGEATGQDIYTLAQAIQKDVLSKFNVELEMEVNRV